MLCVSLLYGYDTGMVGILGDEKIGRNRSVTLIYGCAGVMSEGCAGYKRDGGRI